MHKLFISAFIVFLGIQNSYCPPKLDPNQLTENYEGPRTPRNQPINNSQTTPPGAPSRGGNPNRHPNNTKGNQRSPMDVD